MNDGGDCRTAPATPGLLTNTNTHYLTLTLHNTNTNTYTTLVSLTPPPQQSARPGSGTHTRTNSILNKSQKVVLQDYWRKCVYLYELKHRSNNVVLLCLLTAKKETEACNETRVKTVNSYAYPIQLYRSLRTVVRSSNIFYSPHTPLKKELFFWDS